MRGWTLLVRNVVHRRLLSLFTAAAIAVAVAMFTALLLVQEGAEQAAQTGYGPFELVIGADGSESQLVLSTFYRTGSPTGNIPYSLLPEVSSDAPGSIVYGMTAGDQYRSSPIIGLDPAYFLTRYGDRPMAEGVLYRQLGEVVLGSEAAGLTGLQVGDSFSGLHGLTEHAEIGTEHDEEEEAHEAFKYTVVGVLPPLHTSDDRAIFTTMEYAWAVHNPDQAGQEITAILVKPDSLLQLQALKQKYDEVDNVQATYSSKATADLLNAVDGGAKLLSLVMLVTSLLAAFSLLLSLASAAQQRKRDVGLLRLLGKSQLYILMLLTGEGLLLTVAGTAAGLLLGHGLLTGFGGIVFQLSGVQVNGLTFVSGELPMIAMAVLIGLAASAAPALTLYRTDAVTLFKG